jgi:hypothetical protein
VAVLPQLFAFHIVSTARLIPNHIASGILVSSQLVLLAFVWANRTQPGFWALGLGLGLNLLVIVVNGGWMPISPGTLQKLVPEAPPDTWQIGHRFGINKDIILDSVNTRLWWLSDCFLLPEWFPWRVAYSLGDIFIAFGTFWLLWSHGSGQCNKQVPDCFPTQKIFHSREVE